MNPPEAETDTSGHHDVTAASPSGNAENVQTGTMEVVPDARRLPEKALVGLRRQAVAAVGSGMSQVQAARAFGVSRKTIGTWVRDYRYRGEGAFHSRKRGRRPGDKLALTVEQQAGMLAIIVGHTPDETGLAYRLWTRQAIVELINREFGASLSVTTVANYLVRWNLIGEQTALTATREQPAFTPSAMRPNPRPGIPVAPAPRGDSLRVTWTRAVPTVSTPAGPANAFADSREVNVLVAVSNRGALSFTTSVTPFDGVHVRDFAERLRRQLRKRVTVLICDWPVAHIDTLSAWVADDNRVLLRD